MKKTAKVNKLHGIGDDRILYDARKLLRCRALDFAGIIYEPAKVKPYLVATLTARRSFKTQWGAARWFYDQTKIRVPCVMPNRRRLPLRKVTAMEDCRVGNWIYILTLECGHKVKRKLMPPAAVHCFDCYWLEYLRNGQADASPQDKIILDGAKALNAKLGAGMLGITYQSAEAKPYLAVTITAARRFKTEGGARRWFIRQTHKPTTEAAQ